MEPIIHSSLGTLTLSPSLPMTWKGEILSGSQPYSYDGALGTATLQKFRDEKFSICYAVSNFLQKIKLFWNEEPLLRLQYIMDGRLQYGGTDREWFKIKAGQMNAAWAPGRETAANFPKGRFEIFQIALGPEIVRELLPEFPSINSIPPETSRQWIGGDRQKDIYEILKAPYSDSTRRFFYGIKVREHLLHYLRPMPDKNLNRYPEEIVERIHRVDREILKDLTQHHTNKDLANFARMPEGKLITLFKEIIGVSMFDRYKEAKLERAKKYLLETNEQIKVLYETVGYESYTGFVEAFKERFGLSPLQFRKRFRPFD